jgi:hypothetical protein
MKNSILYRIESVVAAAARRSPVLCLTWRTLRLERSGRLGCRWLLEPPRMLLFAFLPERQIMISLSYPVNPV